MQFSIWRFHVVQNAILSSYRFCASNRSTLINLMKYSWVLHFQYQHIEQQLTSLLFHWYRILHRPWEWILDSLSSKYCLIWILRTLSARMFRISFWMDANKQVPVGFESLRIDFTNGSVEDTHGNISNSRTFSQWMDLKRKIMCNIPSLQGITKQNHWRSLHYSLVRFSWMGSNVECLRRFKTLVLEWNHFLCSSRFADALIGEVEFTCLSNRRPF